MFNRERVILTIEPQAILWYKGIVLYGSIGLPQAKFTNALTLAPSALGRAPTDQMMNSSATPSEKEIRILIVDDHPIVREGLIAVFALEDDLKVVGHAHDGEEACLVYEQLCPDILILDLRMPKKDGIEVVIELMSQKPGPGIIVLTHSAKEEDLRRALAAGAKGVETCSAGRSGSASLPSPFGDHTFTGPDHQYLETA
jgi:CheY-like chemotaxis protein